MPPKRKEPQTRGYQPTDDVQAPPHPNPRAKARDKLPPKKASEGDSDHSDGSDKEQGGSEAEDKGSEGDDGSEGDKRTGAGKEKGKFRGWGDLDGSGDEEQGSLPDTVACKPKSMDELKKMSHTELLAYMM
ncbi:hypothetical protein FRC08_013315 [Ceratobasidium sp. 394]|nr:hypothetical protein FRC08_013315 [Ceratobasidium sp. 394]